MFDKILTYLPLAIEYANIIQHFLYDTKIWKNRIKSQKLIRKIKTSIFLSDLRFRVWQTRAKVAFLFLTEGLYTSDLMEPTARRLASPWRTSRSTLAASLLAKYADRSELVGRRFPGIPAPAAEYFGAGLLVLIRTMAHDRECRNPETINCLSLCDVVLLRGRSTRTVSLRGTEVVLSLNTALLIAQHPK